MLQVNEIAIKSITPQEFSKYFNSDLNILSYFLANCHHETMGFTKLEENLNYSKLNLKNILTKYVDRAQEKLEYYINNPANLANLIYANRMGNGNTESNDGFKFRGRGWLQLTGKANYVLLNKNIGTSKNNIIENPSLLATYPYSKFSALWFWDYRKINSIRPFNGVNIRCRINGGHNGIDEVSKLYELYYEYLSNLEFPNL